MTPDQITYTVFGILLVLALVFDLGLISKKNRAISVRQALFQTIFWVGLAMAFFVFMWAEEGKVIALEYLSAYFMEWSLSIDNIFVFILIFSSFSVKEKFIPRVLLIGIMMAIVFRVIFITVGVALVARFHWILYFFGAFLLYTGIKMFAAKEEDEFNPRDSKVFQFIKRFIPIVGSDGDGRFFVKRQRRIIYTSLFMVVIMLAGIDIVFALDSIPAVMGITLNPLVIYTSNIFALLGLRSLFFLLRGAAARFVHLQEGIAIVLCFIGIKMLGEYWISQWFDKQTMVFISLGVIVSCIGGSILFSLLSRKTANANE
jgi:tellurite resistance protein TerC